jgi:alpha-1,3-glucosyltransferase
MGRWEGGYLAGLAAVEVYGSWAHARLWGADRLPFLPLLLTSLYCALGLLHSFIHLYRLFLSTASSSSARSPAPLKRD